MYACLWSPIFAESGRKADRMNPQDFVSKWKRSAAREFQSVQEQFLDLCALVGHETPIKYGLSDEGLLERLLALNLERARQDVYSQGQTAPTSTM